MRWNSVAIESVAYVLPQNVVTSEMLEDQFAGTLSRLGMPKGQLEKLSGVKERRYWDPGTSPSSVASVAVERALAKANLRPDQVQALVNTSVSRDYLEPATAAMIAGRVGLGHGAISFDVGNACVGFLNGMIALANMIELGQVDNGVVVCAESVREGVEATLRRLASPDATIQTYRDNFASLTLGCAAVAFVLKRGTTGHRLTGAVTRSASEHNTLCLAQFGEMRADSNGLLVHGVGLAAETWPYAREAFGWKPDSVDVVIGHQVSLAHFQAVFARIEQPLDKAILTLPYLGNCGPGSLPVTLAIGEAQGRVVPGQTLCLYAVGSGLSCVIMEVKW
jgi:3-oxoacyl-[acyl-carrier-protein] synthase III